MKVQIYILGFLMKFGPQHGYYLKQLIEEKVSAFARIKMPTIYYYLNKMLAEELVTASEEQAGKRPERLVYTISERGKKTFKKMLTQMLTSRLELEFPFDAVLFFSESLDKQELMAALTQQAIYLEETLARIRTHQPEVLAELAGRPKESARAILTHHMYHYEAELKWVKDILNDLQQT